MARFKVDFVFNTEIEESELMSVIVNALEDKGYSLEDWQQEGDYFYGDYTMEISDTSNT